MRVEGTRSQGIQIRNRFRIDRHGNATAAETFPKSKSVASAAKGFSLSDLNPRKIDLLFAERAQLILPA